MKTIISASRRTDIPAFYLEWFIKAIRTGSVEVRNPFYRQTKRVVDLSAKSVGWIVFWSRNYGHFLKKREVFSEYNLFFHFTILPPCKLEKSPFPLANSLAQIEKLVQFYGAERIIWRYDPLVFWSENNQTKTNHDPQQFNFLCREIGQMGVSRCYTSMVHPYKKFSARFKKHFPEDELINPEIQQRLDPLSEMSQIARTHGLTIYACCSDDLLQAEGVKKGHCIDGSLLSQLKPSQPVSRAKAPSREQCGCTLSIDIGDYQMQPCYFGCLYCYANPK